MRRRFLADQCVPASVIELLRNAGHEVALLRDHLRVDAPDPVVLAKAQEIDAILLSLNGDFTNLIAYPPATFKGIVALQIHNRPEIIPQVIDRLLVYMRTHTQPEAVVGKLLLVEPHRIRVRS